MFRCASDPQALLITGAPGTGKTTLIRRVAARLAGRRLGGFVTDEIREGQRRLGFRLECFDGSSALFAHVDLPSPYRVGRYGVDLATFDRLVAPALRPDRDVEVYLIDEIGKMECGSEAFIRAVTTLLETRRLLVATIAQRGGGFIAEVKARADVELWRLTHANRDALLSNVLAWLDARGVHLLGG